MSASTATFVFTIASLPRVQLDDPTKRFLRDNNVTIEGAPDVKLASGPYDKCKVFRAANERAGYEAHWHGAKGQIAGMFIPAQLKAFVHVTNDSPDEMIAKIDPPLRMGLLDPNAATYTWRTVQFVGEATFAHAYMPILFHMFGIPASAINSWMMATANLNALPPAAPPVAPPVAPAHAAPHVAPPATAETAAAANNEMGALRAQLADLTGLVVNMMNMQAAPMPTPPVVRAAAAGASSSMDAHFPSATMDEAEEAAAPSAAGKRRRSSA